MGVIDLHVIPFFLPLRRFMQLHQVCLGRTRQQIISRGREALRFFANRYSIDIGSEVTDETLLGGKFENDQVYFFTSGSSPTWNLRLLSETRAGQAETYANVPMPFVEWAIIVKQSFESTGTFKGSVPLGASLYFGDYCIDRSKQSGGFYDVNSIHYRANTPYAFFIAASIGDPKKTQVLANDRQYVKTEGLGEGTLSGTMLIQLLHSTAQPPLYRIDLRQTITFPDPDSYYLGYDQTNRGSPSGFTGSNMG